MIMFMSVANVLLTTEEMTAAVKKTSQYYLG